MLLAVIVDEVVSVVTLALAPEMGDVLIVVPEIAPPVIETLLAFWVAIVPKPRLVLAPAAVDAPVPPLVRFKIPPRVTAPVVADDGVNPVVPAENDKTPVFETVTAPVAELTPMPVPATNEVTPRLLRVIDPVPLVTPMAVPPVKPANV